MLRIRSSGQLTAASCGRSARSRAFTARATASSTRQNIQPTGSGSPAAGHLAHLERSGHTAGVRRHRAQHHRLPSPGIAADELFDASPVVTAPRSFCKPRLGEPPGSKVLDLRLRRPLQRAGDQLHLTDRDGSRGPRGFAVIVGGALLGAADRARHGRLHPQEESNGILGAITSVWSEDLAYRVSRVKARLVRSRHRRRRPRASSQARPQARGGLPRCRRSRSSPHSSACRGRRGSPTSASPSTSA